MPQDGTELGVFLDRLQSSYHRKNYLGSDPLEFVHRYSDPWDQEAMALLAALLAYGNVKQIRRSLEDALTRINRLAPSLSGFVRSLRSPASRKSAQKAFASFVHRFNTGPDVVLLFELLARSWEEKGSLGAQFLGHLEPEAETIGDALSALIAEWRGWAGHKRPEYFDYLLTSPQDGSCCKRWCMFLRWMGRKDELDPGLWTSRGAWASGFSQGGFPQGKALHSRQLILPLDTHTGRISQYLRLTERKTLNWKAALEITGRLRAFSPEDPTRYDFALSRLGILDLCQRRYREEICLRCELVGACRFAQKSRRKASSRSRIFS